MGGKGRGSRERKKHFIVLTGSFLFPSTLDPRCFMLEVPAFEVKCHRTEVFREKRTPITINEESEFGPLGEYLGEPLKGYLQEMGAFACKCKSWPRATFEKRKRAEPLSTPNRGENDLLVPRYNVHCPHFDEEQCISDVPFIVDMIACDVNLSLDNRFEGIQVIGSYPVEEVKALE